MGLGIGALARQRLRYPRYVLTAELAGDPCRRLHKAAQVDVTAKAEVLQQVNDVFGRDIARCTGGIMSDGT